MTARLRRTPSFSRTNPLKKNEEDRSSSDVRFNRLSASTESYTLQAVDPDIAAILVKDKNGEPLTEVEGMSVRF